MKLELTTDRLILKMLFPEDAERIAEFYKRNIPFLAEWEPNVSAAMADPKAQENALNYEVGKVKNGTFIRYWYSAKENPDILLGTVCFQNITMSAFHNCDIGYKQDIASMHKGYATEASQAAINHLFRDEGIHRINAQVVQNNEPSIRLAKRLGFSYEGEEKSSVYINGAWKDCYRYALINEADR